jgi:hypothetical protein
MRGLYCQSDESFVELLRPMFAHLDSLYWIVDCQMGPVRTDWIYESDDHEQLHERMHVDVPAFDSTSTRLWRPGSLSLVRQNLYFDEWSYFVGFQSAEADAVARATRIGFPSFTPQFYAMLEHEGELCLLHVDGWWEFYPARAELFSRIQALTSWREIVPRQRDSWTPQFV